MYVYRCENQDGEGMYGGERCKSSLTNFWFAYGLSAIKYEFNTNNIEFDESNHPPPRLCFDDEVLDNTIYSSDLDTKRNSIFGFSSTTQLFNWLNDVNVLYCLQTVFGIKVVVYEIDYCYEGGCQCIFDRRAAKKHDEFHIDEFYKLHQCETILKEVSTQVIELCRL